MRRWLLGSLLVGLFAAAGLAACGDAGNAGSLRGGPGGSSGSSGATTPTDDGGGATDGINTTGVGAGTGANTGLPCDVQQLLENRCIGCHLGTSPPALLTYDDLMKPSSVAGETLAQRSLARMKDTASPMPPPPAEAPTAAEIATFEAWVNAGAPKGAACTPQPGDAGADGGTTSTGTNYNTPLVCTSNTTWNQGNEGSSRMRPGGACITCHTMRGGPAYVVAGTVYPTAHEPNDCNGSNGAALSVIVTDANGKTTTIPVNSVGNFYTRTQIPPPFHVKVSNGTKERAMAGALTAGDCNSCHTVDGANGAPGRIMAP